MRILKSSDAGRLPSHILARGERLVKALRYQAKIPEKPGFRIKYHTVSEQGLLQDHRDKF